MYHFSRKHLQLKVFEVQTSGIKHGKFLKKAKKKHNIDGILIWRMQNFVKFGGNLIWRITKKRKIWREFNLAV